MKKWKILAVILMLGLIAVICCACGENFVYTSYTDENGGVHHEILFTYDANAADASVVKTEAVAIMQRFVEEKHLTEYAKIDYSKDGEVLLSLYYPSVTDYYIAHGYTGREKNESNGDYQLSGIFKVYDEEVDTYLTKENIDYIRKLADEEYKDFPLKGKFYYVYGTQYNAIRSNGTVSQSDGIYYHRWELFTDKPTKMILRHYVVNGILLYGIIISVFVLSLLIIFVIIYSRKKKERIRRTPATAEDPKIFEEYTSSEKKEE